MSNRRLLNEKLTKRRPYDTSRPTILLVLSSKDARAFSKQSTGKGTEVSKNDTEVRSLRDLLLSSNINTKASAHSWEKCLDNDGVCSRFLSLWSSIAGATEARRPLEIPDGLSALNIFLETSKRFTLDSSS